MTRNIGTRVLICAALAAGAAAARAADLSVWAFQADLRAAAGDPATALPPGALAYNPVSGRLLIACGSTNATIFEWERGATTGTVLVARAAWGAAGDPAPYGAAYVPARGTYLVASGGGDDVIFEVAPGVAGQTPVVYLAPVPPTFPAGGLVEDGTYAYYKNQWTGVQQTVNRVTLTGPPASEEEYIPKAAFDAWNLAGPAQQLALDSAGVLHLAGRPAATGGDAVRGIYRWDAGAGALVPVLTFAQITAFTGQTHVGIYGMTFDAADCLYFYEIYSGSIIRRDRRGGLSTLLTAEDVRALLGDPQMQVHPSYMQVVNTDLVFVSGNVSGHVLAARLPLVEPDMVAIPATDHEPGGPAYTYHIGRFEITNAQYCVFLNDAERIRETAPDDPRCAHMWIDPLTGDVYMMDVTGLPYGPEWYDRTLYKTSDLPDSKIKYDPARAPGSRFYVLPGFAHHPVGTVSWFGAAKFCNWLTLHAGLDAGQRCYREGTSKHDWVPVTAGDWAARGLLPAERFALVREHRGYRLPMDGVNTDGSGPGVAHSWNNTANPYNEWYKAAAFDPAAPDTVRSGPGDGELVPPDHWTFGFGADACTAADANLALSDPPYEETTPVGWYDGVHTLADGTPTADTRNRYGLYDLCGNAAEWIGDTTLNYPWDATYRATRGGRWSNSDPRWATNSIRVVTIARYYAENNLGFRVVRAAGYADFDGNGAVDPADFALLAAALGGPDVPADPALGHAACDADGDADVDLADCRRFQVLFGVTFGGG